ncbi:MAG: acyltransferase [Planctomycetes bacterium]|nr:acyltransferase [Planctomycetota bacterium]
MTVQSAQSLPGSLRLEWVDYARGIGIFLVVVGHTLSGVINAGLLEPSATTGFVHDWIYAFHMPLFFFLSGLFAERSLGKGSRRFVSDKLRTIAYPYVVWSLLQTSVQIFMSRYTNSPANWETLLSIVYVAPMQFWFLYALFLCFLFFLCCWHLALGRWGFLGVVAALTVVQTQFGLGSWGIIYQAVANLPYFALGILASKLVQNALSVAKWPSALAVTAAGYGSVILFVRCDGWDDGFRRLLSAISGIAGTLALAALLSRSRLLVCVQRWGQASIPIFVAHTLASAGFRIALQRLAHVSDPAIHLVGGVLVSLYVPIMLAAIARRAGFDYLFAWPARTTEVAGQSRATAL